MVIKATKIILVNQRNKEVLLYLRDNKPSIPHPGYWDLFGGSIEEGESPLESIKREVKEEIGIKIKDPIFLGDLFYKKDSLCNYNTKISVFTDKVVIPLDKIKLTEGQKLEYFKLEELSKIKFPPFYKDFIIKNREILGV